VLLGPTASADQPTGEGVVEALIQVLRLEDLGLTLEGHGDVSSLQSEQFVIDDLRAQAASTVARELGIPAQPVLTHIANSISIGDRSIPYSTITALDPPTATSLGSFRLLDGQDAPRLTTDEILLNRWAADDLGAVVGDPVEIVYYALGARDELTTESRILRLRGIVEMAGLALDPHLTPDFPGIQDAADISAWDPPFPVDLDRIRPRDELYWDLHRAAPKAFVSTELGRELWTTRFGSMTSLRLASKPDGTTPAALEAGLRQRITPREAGLVLRPLREEALRAARGATDFSGLFIGLSLFLIVSAALLSGLLFRLGVEQRSAELGLLRATGFPLRSVRRRFLGEGLLLAALGSALGLAGGAAYAWVLLAGLRSWWLPAIGEPVLFLHVAPTSLALGGVISMAVVGLAIAGALRHLRTVSIVSLLAGDIAPADQVARPSRRALWVGSTALAIAAGLSITALTVDARTAAGLAFGVGATLLIAGIALFSHVSGHATRRANGLGRGGRAAMAMRSSGRNHARSRLCVALMACASFVIIIVAANRVHGEIDVAERTSGAGGFTLVAETDVPIYGDLAGVSPAAADILGSSQVVPFRFLAGEDISCLNLYQPERPRILGAPVEMVARGGFRFQQTSAPVDNPWLLLEEDLGPDIVPAIGDYNSVLWILHSGLGKDLVVENELGEAIRLRFVALLNKSLFQSEIVISEANFQRHFPSRTGYSYFLLDPDPSRTAEVAAGLESELVRLGFDAVATEDRLAAFQAVEDTYLSTFQTLGGLGLLLGTLGMGVILLRNVLERRSELAALRALGFRRSHLRGLVLMENAFLLLVGLAVGTAAGGAAAAPRLIAAGQDLPWLSLLLTLAAVFAIGMLASTVASRAVTHLPLLASLQTK
jgi:hypothetical protein